MTIPKVNMPSDFYTVFNTRAAQSLAFIVLTFVSFFIHEALGGVALMVMALTLSRSFRNYQTQSATRLTTPTLNYPKGMLWLALAGLFSLTLANMEAYSTQLGLSFVTYWMIPFFTTSIKLTFTDMACVFALATLLHTSSGLVDFVTMTSRVFVLMAAWGFYVVLAAPAVVSVVIFTGMLYLLFNVMSMWTPQFQSTHSKGAHYY